MRREVINATTNTAGSATAYSGALTGILWAVQLVDGDLADGVDITLTCEDTGATFALLTKADFNSDQLVYPRVATVNVTDGSADGGTAAPLVMGRIKMVLAQGGSAKTGGCICYVIEA